MYALVEILGKQYKVEKGLFITVDNMTAEPGAAVEFSSVLLLNSDGKVSVGAPFVKGATVKGSVTEHIKGDKVLIYKYKRRKSYHRRKGHRQKYSVVMIEDIVGA